MTPFTESVVRLIKKIPVGKVSTYGQIAKLAGNPHGARGVSWILHSCTRTHKLPWFRVIGGKIDLKAFGWKRKPSGRSASTGMLRR